jgi:hypothetical protein
MRRLHTKWLTSFIAALLVGSAAPAQGKDSPEAPPPPVKNPLEDDVANPLTEADLFAGEYEGDEVIMIIKVSGNGYDGEIRRAGRAFPLKAVREGRQMVGTFSHENTPFKFTAQFEGQALKLSSGSKVFLLKRKDASATAVLAPQSPPTRPQPPVPPPPPVSPVVPSLPTPIAPPTTPLAPAPVKPKPAETPLPVDYAKLTSQQLADAVWTRFRTDAFVVMEETAGTSQILGRPQRTKYFFSGATEGVPSVRIQRWEGKEWGKPVPAAATLADECRRPDELGYTKEATREETLTIDGKPLVCQCTRYTGETVIGDGTLKLSLEVWRARTVDHPPILLDTPAKRLVVEPDVVRIHMESEYKGLTASIDMKLEALGREVQIGDLIVTCAVIKAVASHDMLTPRSTVDKTAVTTEYWLSHQVPGGVVRKFDTEQTGQRRRTLERQVIEFVQGK